MDQRAIINNGQDAVGAPLGGPHARGPEIRPHIGAALRQNKKDRLKAVSPVCADDRLGSRRQATAA